MTFSPPALQRNEFISGGRQSPPVAKDIMPAVEKPAATPIEALPTEPVSTKEKRAPAKPESQTKKGRATPWGNSDPSAQRTRGHNVRLNDYEMSLIAHAADKLDRSKQQAIIRHLVPILEYTAGVRTREEILHLLDELKR